MLDFLFIREMIIKTAIITTPDIMGNRTHFNKKFGKTKKAQILYEFGLYHSLWSELFFFAKLHEESNDFIFTFLL